MIVDEFQEALSTMQLQAVWSVSIPALSKGKRIGWMECRVKRLSKLLVMCQPSALLVGKGECLKGAKGRDTTVNKWSNQRNFTNYYHWTNSSLRGDSQSCNSGDPPAIPS